MRQHYEHDFNRCKKLIVGEGESDLSFFKAFCVRNVIEGFEYAFVGEHEVKDSGEYGEAGFDNFGKYLTSFGRTTSILKLTDIVLVCDSGDIPAENPDRRFTLLRNQIAGAVHSPGKVAYVPPIAPNVLNTAAILPRIHILIVPWNDEAGGIETTCLQAAYAAAGQDANPIFNCVEGFADCVDISNLTTEKRDKFRLQSFLSGSWKTRPEIRAEQVWATHRSALFALNAAAFDRIRTFLRAVEALP